MKFKKKPVVIESLQLTRQSFDDIVKWIHNCNGRSVECHYDQNNDDNTYILIKTLEGDMRANLTDWVIRGVKNEFYPCKDDIFRMTYEECSE